MAKIDAFLTYVKLYLKILHMPIADVRVAYIRNLAILSNRRPIVTADYSPVFCSYLWGPLDLNPR